MCCSGFTTGQTCIELFEQMVALPPAVAVGNASTLLYRLAVAVAVTAAIVAGYSQR
jgi:hypothetical protein